MSLKVGEPIYISPENPFLKEMVLQIYASYRSLLSSAPKGMP